MKKILKIISILFLGSQLIPGIVCADDTMGYSISATIPGNQIDKTLTYFDLKMEPNQKQDIFLTVSNSSDKDQTILISPNNAKTNQNGVIDYSDSKKKKDSSLDIPLTSIISEAQEVSLAAKERKQVKFSIQMPRDEFDGIILGGFYITKKEDSEKEKNSEKKVMIKNNYSYVIGIKLRENTKEVEPIIKLNEVKPILLNYRTAITANLQNTEATLIKNISIDAKVMKKGDSKVLHEVLKKDISMAPNSNFDFPIGWGNKSLEEGTYTLKLRAQSGSNTWRFKKDFKISEKDSKKLNKEAVELEKKEPNWMVVGISIISVMFLLIILVIIMIFKYRKKKEEEKRARLVKQRKRKKRQELIKKKKRQELIKKKNI